MRLTASVFVVSNCLLLVGCGKQKLTFQEFTSAECGFTVQVPGAPKKTTQTVAGGITQTIFSVELKNGAFQVFFQEMPGGARGSYDDAIQLLKDQFGGTLNSQRDVELQGHKGREFEMQITKPVKGYVVSRMLATPNRLYQVQVVGANYQLSDPDVQTFLNSFKLKE